MKKLLIFAFVFLASCGLFFTPPDVVVSDVKIVTADTAGVNLDVYFQINNRNGYDVTMKGYTYDIKVLNLPLAHGGGRETVVFAGDTITDYRLPVRVSYKDLIEIVKHRPDIDRIPYTINGGFEVDTPIGTRMFPVAKSGTFCVPEQYRPSFYLNKFLDIFRSGDSQAQP